MILVPSTPLPHHHPHHLHPPPHPHHHPNLPPPQCVELAQAEVAVAAAPSSRVMPESGDIDVLAPPRIHLASRRRFELKLDLASALSGRERGCEATKKPRLELFSSSSASTTSSTTAPATTTLTPPPHHPPPASSTVLTSKLSDSMSCGSCLSGQRSADTSPIEQESCSTIAAAAAANTAASVHSTPNTCRFRTINQEERLSSQFCDLSSSPPSPSSAASIRSVSSSELAAKLRKARPVLVIDCRPFLCYNSHHVQGALNISCTDRFNRRRLQQGKIKVMDLLPPNLRKRHVTRDVVLYDDRSVGPHVLDTDSALSIVLTRLLKDGQQPAVLQGGMKQFEAEFPELCWSSRPHMELPGRLLCSPTNDTIEPEIETATASQVLSFLYLGNERDAADLDRLRRHNITYVLNVTGHVPQYWQAHGIRYKRIPASDSAQQNLKQYFEEALEFIDDARQNNASVLIHCHAGVSRSATITIAYILKHTKMAMSDAYKFVKGKRSIISPNFNFLGQLLEFEQDLNEGNSLRILNPRLVELESTV